VIGLREASVALLRWHAGRQGVVLHVSPLGKAKTCVQMTAIVGLMLVPDPEAAWVTAGLLAVVGLTVVSGLQYLLAFARSPVAVVS
jgi:phosphatidylglycerophosphate synthase